jgi:hypothetical protein
VVSGEAGTGGWWLVAGGGFICSFRRAGFATRNKTAIFTIILAIISSDIMQINATHL